MAMPGKAAIVIGLIVALSACTSPASWTRTWTRPGATATAEEIQDASLECRQLARSERWRQDWENRWPPGFYDRRFMSPYYYGAHPFWRDFPPSIELEQDLYQFCMHSKGFGRNGVSP